jgi:hypothetical protein
MKNAPVLLRVCLITGFAAACGGQATPTASPTLAPATATPAAATATAPPTASPSPIPTPTATPAGLLPDGGWTVDLTDAEFAAAGAEPGHFTPGRYTWSFAGNRARLAFPMGDQAFHCSAQASKTEGGVRFDYLAKLGCGGWSDVIRWSLESDGLHLKLVDSTAPRADNAPYLEAKPWQPTTPESIEQWPDWYVRCEPGCHGPISSAVFTSTELYQGLSLTFGQTEWLNTRDDDQEIEFDLGDSALRFWRHARPSQPNGDPVPGIDGIDEMTDWFARDSNVVISHPESVTLGNGIPATTFTLVVADDAVNADPECPFKSCLDLMYVADNHTFGIGYGSVERFYFFEPGNGDVITITLDTPDEATFDSVDPMVSEMLGTLTVPQP